MLLKQLTANLIRASDDMSEAVAGRYTRTSDTFHLAV